MTCAVDNAALDYDRSTAGTSQGARLLGRHLFPGENQLFSTFTDIGHGVMDGSLLKSKRTCANRTYFSHFVDFHLFLLSP